MKLPASNNESFNVASCLFLSLALSFLISQRNERTPNTMCIVVFVVFSCSRSLLFSHSNNFEVRMGFFSPLLLLLQRDRNTQHTYVQNKQRNDVMRSHSFTGSFTAVQLFFFFLFVCSIVILFQKHNSISMGTSFVLLWRVECSEEIGLKILFAFRLNSKTFSPRLWID